MASCSRNSLGLFSHIERVMVSELYRSWRLLPAPDAQARCDWLNKSPMQHCHGTVPHLATGKAIGSGKSPKQERHNMHCEPAGLPTWLSTRSLAATKEQRHTMPSNTISRTKVQCINTHVFYILKITSIPLKNNTSVNLHPKRSVHR